MHRHVILQRVGSKDLGRAVESKTRGKDSSHRVTDIVEDNRFSDKVRISAESTLPQTVTDDHCRARSCAILFGLEIASDRRTDAKNRKKVCGNSTAKYSIGSFRR